MKNITIAIILLLTLGTSMANASKPKNATNGKIETPNDTTRLAELNNFWSEVSRTVNEGDFEGYKATYHEDAVVVFKTGENKTSVSIAEALQHWEQGFLDTKAGKTQNSVEFRFSERIGGETTAHETGIFAYQSTDGTADANQKHFVHFDALLIKRDKAWLLVMEYQKSKATEEEWNSLE